MFTLWLMIYPDIYFPSGAKCIVASVPPHLVDESDKMEYILKIISESSYEEVFFYYPSDKEKRIAYKFTVPFFQKNKIPYFPIDGRKLFQRDFKYLEKLSNYIQKKSQSGNILILFPSEESTAYELLLPILFLRKLHTNPSIVMNQTIGRSDITKNDEIICEYLSYLNSNYSIPTRFRRKILIGNKPQQIKKTRLSIRTKLLGIVSVILALSISGMIYFASHFFKETITVMVQDYNLNLSRLIGDVIESDLENLIYRTNLFSEIWEKEKSESFKNETVDRYFLDNPSVVFYTTGALIKNEFTISNKIFNRLYEKDYSFDQSVLESVLIDDTGYVSRARDVAWLENITNRVGYPMLLVYLPSGGSGEGKRFIFVTPGYFLKSLQSSRQADFFELHLIASNGTSILSSHPNLNVSELPIAKKMLESGIDNGSQRFNYQGVAYLGSFRIVPKFGMGVISSVPEDKSFAAVYKIQRQNLLILIMVLSISFLFVFLFSKTLTNPIIRLVRATRNIEEGNYDVNIEPSTQDEIGLLTSSFREMANGLKERERIKDEFGKFVNPEIADRALKGELSLGGERKECTVFFSDIRSFTALSESREPEKVVEILNEYFTEMVDCVHLTGGVVDKFIGDAVMAHWGAILPEVGGAKKAVDSALLMRHSLISLNNRLVKKGVPPIRIGCGINSGPAIAGQIGSHKRKEFTVIGDAVNLASRVEYLNKDFGTDILVSESTYLMLNDLYDCIPMEPIYVRGKEKPQQTYAVLGKKNDENRPKSLKELRELVGIPEPSKKEPKT